jgi:hypothetical protein
MRTTQISGIRHHGRADHLSNSIIPGKETWISWKAFFADSPADRGMEKAFLAVLDNLSDFREQKRPRRGKSTDMKIKTFILRKRNA